LRIKNAARYFGISQKESEEGGGKMDGLKSLIDFQDGFVRKVNEKSPDLLKGDVAAEVDSKKEFPVATKADFSLLISEIIALKETQNLFKDVMAELRTDFGGLLRSKDYNEFADNFKDLVEIDALKKLPEIVRGIVHMEVGLMLSFGAATKNLKGFKIEDYEDNFRQYFFSKNGYVTVSGNLITPPRLPKVGSLADIKDLGNRIEGERYIRDMTRIIVETSGDKLYDLRKRYKALEKKYPDDANKKLIEWFDSFGDLAEASLLPTVEGIISGAFNLQLNPLVAAAVGTFCSVTVRKATEHSYLMHLGIPQS
jgi:hypothetical protein